jgi:drug/metabolite transporter superfamily protein YnfA
MKGFLCLFIIAGVCNIIVIYFFCRDGNRHFVLIFDQLRLAVDQISGALRREHHERVFAVGLLPYLIDGRI